MGAQDGDSAETLAYKKGWKIIDGSYAFSNGIRLIVFLNTGKLVKFYQNVFFFKNMILNKVIRSISYDNRQIQILLCF